jgi:putative membrane protein
MSVPKSPMSSLATHVVFGALMGGADIIPGVSGGTVALLLGIYERLVTAISRFDLTLLGMLRRREWRRMAVHVDLALLVPLGCGILIGFAIMTVLMHHLLSTSETRAMTMAVFFGLILASGLVVARMVRHDSRGEWIRSIVLGLAAAAFAWWLTGLDTGGQTQPSLFFVFCSGAVAICAMILPGISGAMVLLILGIYLHLTEIPKNLLHGEQVVEGILTVAVFGVGCVTGLLSFSKLLRWLLANYHGLTMAVLCGFMLGSLRKLWPFQRDLTPSIDEVKFKSFRPYIPDQVDEFVLAVVAVAALAMGSVFVAHAMAARRQSPPASDLRSDQE